MRGVLGAQLQRARLQGRVDLGAQDWVRVLQGPRPALSLVDRLAQLHDVLACSLRHLFHSGS